MTHNFQQAYEKALGSVVLGPSLADLIRRPTESDSFHFA